MAKLLADSGDPDQTLHPVASDLGLHYLQLPFYGSPDYNGIYIMAQDPMGSKFPHPYSSKLWTPLPVFLYHSYPKYLGRQILASSVYLFLYPAT